MEKDPRSWFQHQHINWQLPNSNSPCPQTELEKNKVPTFMNPWNDNVSVNITQPLFSLSGLPYNNAIQSNEPHGWFYCLPRYRQTFDPNLGIVPKEKGNRAIKNFTNAIPDCSRKKFLVFDKTGDQTTLVFSSGLEDPVQYLPSWHLQGKDTFDLNKEHQVTKWETNQFSRPVLNDDVSEMPEDSEELDDLLYCDDDNSDHFDDDDEVTSTGHSPSSLTDYDYREDQESSDESGEEVASSSTPVKRQKLVNGGYEVYRRLEYNDDAESCCGESKNPVFGELGSSMGEYQGFVESDSLIGSKRSRREKIQTTMSILQSIIPGGIGEDKDPVSVIDEAINYLESLKVKAEALGSDAL